MCVAFCGIGAPDSLLLPRQLGHGALVQRPGPLASLLHHLLHRDRALPRMPAPLLLIFPFSILPSGHYSDTYRIIEEQMIEF